MLAVRAENSEPEPTSTQELFLGRQPILDRDQNLVAFELLFRSSLKNSADIGDDFSATATVINHAFSNLGLETVLGKYRGFVNLDASLIMSDMIELLPKDKIVLEILETVKVTGDIVERCKYLKSLGFSLALDDFYCYSEEYRPLLALVDCVKVDIMQVDNTRLWSLAKQLKPWRVKLLAEKVDTREQAKFCRDLGFDLFQGYYFARPEIMTGKRMTHSEATLMQLLALSLSDADSAEIEQTLKRDPGLTINLMRMVNSVAMGSRRNITSLSAALMVFGRRQLQRWLQLLLYTNHAPGTTFPSPLLQLVATRAKLLELLAGAERPGNKDFADRAFITGIMSLIDVLLHQPIADILAPLPIGDDVKAAILRHEGRLGQLLTLVERLDQNDQPAIEALLVEFPALGLDALNSAQAQAIQWANSLGEQRAG